MKAIKTTLGALAVAATALAAMPATTVPAQAGDIYIVNGGKKIVRCGRHGHRCVVRQHRPRHHGNHRHRSHNNGDAAAAAIIGVIGGAIIAGALSDAARKNDRTIYVEPVHPRHRGSSGYYPPAPAAPRGDQVITFAGSLEPWTQGWYEWCDARFKTFDPERGTYRGYDGKDHFCVPR